MKLDSSSNGGGLIRSLTLPRGRYLIARPRVWSRLLMRLFLQFTFIVTLHFSGLLILKYRCQFSELVSDIHLGILHRMKKRLTLRVSEAAPRDPDFGSDFYVSSSFIKLPFLN